MRFLFVVSTFLFFGEAAFSQVWTWDSLSSYVVNRPYFVKDSQSNVYSFYHKHNTKDTQIVRKLNSNAHLLWSLVIPPSIHLTSIAPAADSSVYFAGNCGGTFTFEDSTYTVPAHGNAWVAKYSDQGKLKWFQLIKRAGPHGGATLGDICTHGDELVLSGSASHPLYFFGELVPKNSDEDLFIARVNSDGMLQKIGFSTKADTATAWVYSSGYDCAVDATGNIYVLGVFSGTHKVGPFAIGKPRIDFDYPYETRALIKFDQQLQVKYATTVYYCGYACNGIFDLIVNSIGQCFFIESHNYSQSGGDDHWSKIWKFGATGSPLAYYQPRPDRKGGLADIDIDECDNLYFTGIIRNYINAPELYYGLLNGQISPNLEQQWIRVDSTRESLRIGQSLVVLSPNNLLVTGFFTDSIKLFNNHTVGVSSFFARLSNPAEFPCNVVSTKTSNAMESYVYPNPCEDVIHIVGREPGLTYSIFSTTGHLISKQTTFNRTCEIDTRMFPTGIYFVSMTDGKSSENLKFVKVK